MLDFLKRLIREKEPQAVRIRKQELKSWLKKEMDKAESELDDNISEALARVGKISKDIHAKLDTLDKAELHNKKVSAREINFMTGNREAYIRHTKEFLKKLPDSFNPAEDLPGFRKQLELLSRSNQRPYVVLQQFFANESRQVAEQIKQISNEFEMIQKRSDELNISGYSKALALLKEEESHRLSKKELEKEKSSKEHELREIEAAKKKTIEKLEAMKKGQDFKEVQGLKESLEQKKAELKYVEDEFSGHFSGIDSALKKYSRVAMDPSVIDAIVRSPVDAANRYSSDILLALDGMKAAIANGSLELKDKKKDKAIHALDNISSELIQLFAQKHARIKQEKSEIEAKLRQSRVMGEYEELEYKLEPLDSKADVIRKEIAAIEKRVERADSDSKKEIIEEISSFIDREIEITG